jgi:hypothetical protein
MAGTSEQGKATRATSRGRSSSNGSRGRKSSSSGSTRARNTSARAKDSSRARGSSQRTQNASQRSRSSSQRNHSSRQNHAGREVLTNAGIGALSAAIGVAGGVLLGRSTAQRGRKVLGVPVPEKIDLGGIGQQIGDAGRQFGKLATEVRNVREKAEQVGRILT